MAETPVTGSGRGAGFLGLLLVGLLMAGLLWLSTAAAGTVPERGSELDRWFEDELAPWLRTRLTAHPRLRGEPLTVAVVDGRAVDPTPDALSAALSQRLHRLLLETPGTVLARRPTPPDWQQPGSPQLDCRPFVARYLLAVETASESGSGRVDVRVMDLDEDSWVSGFVRSWRGRLTRDEQAAGGRSVTAETERGRRGLPYESGQPDLLAGRLAYSLGCGLLAQPEDGLTVWRDESAGAGGYADAVGLVGNYLARAGVIRPAASRDQADLILSGRLHDVDGSLKQLWVSLRARSADGPGGLEATAYVRTEAFPAAAVADAPRSVPTTPAVRVEEPVSDAALASLRVLRLPRPCRPGDCDARGEPLDASRPLPANGSLALEAVSPVEARVFLLELAPGHGLRRLAPADCRPGTGVALGPGTRLRHPLAAAASGATLFVVALRPGGEDRRLAELFTAVPSGCGARPLQAAGLSRWLARFDAAVRGRDVDWQALRLTFEPARGGALLASDG
jgi:hypothetical protein